MAPPPDEGGSPQHGRDVRPDLGAHLRQFGVIQAQPPQIVQRGQGRRRVGAAASEARRGRDLLVQTDLGEAADASTVGQGLGGSEGQVRLVHGHPPDDLRLASHFQGQRQGPKLSGVGHRMNLHLV
jgi:hypothetical protein